MLNRLFSVAPMMDWTDRHERYFLRLIAPHALLYTEMVTANAILHGKNDLLAYHPSEHPVALQLGGSEPDKLALCAKIGEDRGYDEINLNVGCPSDRVKRGRFGACLMLEPQLVADCVSAMNSKVNIPVTVKCRIGVDDRDSFDELCQFIETIASAGCHVFIIHARKAWLDGLSPKENRTIPPLHYEIVQRVKQCFPHLTIVVNGGIKDMENVALQLSWADGVMIGREAYSNPYFLTEIEKKYFSTTILSRIEIIEKYIPYVEDQLKKNIKLSTIVRHILGLFLGQPGGRKWRRYLSENSHLSHTGIEVIQHSLEVL